MTTPSGRARNTDPQTSHDAAARVAEHEGSVVYCIQCALGRVGNGTFHQIAAEAGLDAATVHKRLPEMEREGIVRVVVGDDFNEVTRPGPSGRQCRVWELVP